MHTYATARASALLGETVPVEAGAFYRLPLTGLHITARLTTPGGAQVAFTLTDVDGTGEDTGAASLGAWRELPMPLDPTLGDFPMPPRWPAPSVKPTTMVRR